MLCALEVTGGRLNTPHFQCNTSVDQNINNNFPKGQQIHRSDNRDSTSTELPLGQNSDWKFLSDVQEVNKRSCLSSEAAGTESLELLPPQPTVLYWLGQPNEKNMHDQDDSSKSLSTGIPQPRSTLRQNRHRRKANNLSTTCPPCNVLAKRSDSDVLHDDGKPPKLSPKKKGNKKGKQYRRPAHKKLNLSSEIHSEENIDAASPVEVLLTDLLADKLSATSFTSVSLAKGAHLGTNICENSNECVGHGTTLNLSTLESDEIDGSECTGSSNETAGEICSCNGAPYLNDGLNSTDSSEFDGSSFIEHGHSHLGEESNNYQKSLCACVYNSDDATTHSYFTSGKSGNSVNCSARFEHGASAGPNELKKSCHMIGGHLSSTCADDLNDSFSRSSCCPKYVADSSSHTERVKCSSEACSSKTSLQGSSGRSSRKSSKGFSSSNLTGTKGVVGANRHKHSGKESSGTVWQKVEKQNKENSSRAGHVIASASQYKSALEDTNKVVHHDPTKPMEKHNQSRKSCSQHFPDETVEMEHAKDNDSLNSCQTISRCIHKKQTPFLYEQTSLSSKQGTSQSSRNCYAPKNGITKVPKDQSQQKDRLPVVQLVYDKDTSDRSISVSSADTAVGSNNPTEGNGSSQSCVEKAELASCNSDTYLAPQATSEESCASTIQKDPCSFCPGSKAMSTTLKSRNLGTDHAEMEETCYVKLTDENTQEFCKLYSAGGHGSRKWVPVGKKDIIHSDAPELSAVEASNPTNDISISANIDFERNVSDVPASANGEGSKLAAEISAKLNSSGQLDLKCQAYTEIGTNFSKIREAVCDAYRAQQSVEDVQLNIDRPLADFERFIYSASPVLYCSPCATGCNSHSREWIRDSLCFHQATDITLSSIWQWYEEPGCYGLEVKAQDLRRSKGLWDSHYQFTAYFVPFLSAVQLFGQSKRTSVLSVDKEADNVDVTANTSPCLSSLPILEKLLPQQSYKRNNSHTSGDQHFGSGELLFEFFESEQPFWRRQLFDKVKELTGGVKPSNCQISGDPKNLELSLSDLHPASWYCVAWYPIYRIPDGKFQASFLTYHSLGHWIPRRSSSDQAGHAPVVLPVTGLHSYNDKGEWWYQMSRSGSEDVESIGSPSSKASQVLKERVRTLNQAAVAMARANVRKNDEMCRNRHPDYEFFLSRNR